MSEEDPLPEECTRPPTVEDLLLVCRHLNERGARYILIGGLAMFELGLARATEDIDFLVDPSEDNVARIKDALACLPDGASREVADGDVANYVVVRINDEITVDLMASACGVQYKEAVGMMEWREIRGVRVPIANAQLLWITKQTYREKDALDRSFLRQWFADHGQEPPTTGMADAAQWGNL